MACERLSFLKQCLRVALFDDGFNTCVTWIPFAGLHEGKAVYKQTQPAFLADKKYYDKGNVIANETWTSCAGDMRAEPVFLDIEGYTFGRIKLGKYWDAQQRRAKARHEELPNGSIIDYNMEYNQKRYMTWFRLHEIRLPLNRVRRGVSNDNI